MQRHKQTRASSQSPSNPLATEYVEYHPSMSLEAAHASSMLELLATADLPSSNWNDERRQSMDPTVVDKVLIPVTLGNVLHTRNEVWTSVQTLLERLGPHQQTYECELSTLRKLVELHMLCKQREIHLRTLHIALLEQQLQQHQEQDQPTPCMDQEVEETRASA